MEEGQADVLIAFERLEALRYRQFLKKDGVIIVNDQRIDPITVVTGVAEYPEGILDTLRETHKVYAVDAMKVAKELGESQGVQCHCTGCGCTAHGLFKGRMAQCD